MNQFLQNRLARGTHIGTAIDFNEPHFEIFIHHEIVPVKFKAVLSIIHFVLNALGRCLYLLLNLWPNDVSVYAVRVGKPVRIIFCQESVEVVTWPYVVVLRLSFAAWFGIFLLFFDVLLNNAIICQMGVFIGALRIIVSRCKPHIAFLVGPYCQWVPICNQNPLSDVELPALYNQWIFYILLYHPFAIAYLLIGFPLLHMLHHLVVIFEHSNSTTSRHLSWLHNPQILITIQFKLREILFHFI